MSYFYHIITWQQKYVVDTFHIIFNLYLDRQVLWVLNLHIL